MAWVVRLCLSYVTLLHPTQRAKILGNIFAVSSNYGLGQFVLDMHELKSK